LLDRWLCDGRCYHLDLVGGPHSNPEGRIAEDARIATEAPVELAIGLTTAVLSAATFIVVLWTVGGAVTVEIAGAAVTVPGFLVVAAAVYAALASGTMFLIGRRLIVASERKSQAEAEYRYGLTRLREDAEGIALLEGEHEERRGAERSFRAVVGAWRDVCLQSMRTTVVSQTSGYTAPILPIILCAPKFLDGALTLGEVMQAASAFVLVQSALNWMVDNYPRLAEWVAAARRVHTPRCGCATSRSCARTGWRSSQVPSSRSCRERSSSSPAPPAPARARWCARSRARGPGAAAGSRFVPARGYWCCRSALTSRPVRCVAS
jgi:putative ATP-binding cassette transporter